MKVNCQRRIVLPFCRPKKMRTAKVRVKIKIPLGQKILLNLRQKVLKATSPQLKVIQRDVLNPNVIIGLQRTVVRVETAACVSMTLSLRASAIIVDQVDT